MAETLRIESQSSSDVQHPQLNLVDLLVGPQAKKEIPIAAEGLRALQLGSIIGMGSRVVGNTWSEEAAQLSLKSAGSLAGAQMEPLRAFPPGLVKGASLGFGAALVDVGINAGLRKYYGAEIAGHDLFRTTNAEELGISMAAAAPIDRRLRVGLMAASWLGGRLLNYFHK